MLGYNLNLPFINNLAIKNPPIFGGLLFHFRVF